MNVKYKFEERDNIIGERIRDCARIKTNSAYTYFYDKNDNLLEVISNDFLTFSEA